MSIRPKTAQRVTILAILFLVIFGGGFAAYRVRMYFVNAGIMQAKKDGMAAFAAGDYQGAIDKLNLYVIKHKDDPEALLAFGIARSKVPTLDNSHISHAIAIIRRYCELKPDDVEHQHLLIEMQTPYAQYAAAALENCKDLLRTDPNDQTALKAIALIQLRQRNFRESLDAATKYSDLNPTDLEMQADILHDMNQLGRTPIEMHTRADMLAKTYPNDPRFLLVQAMAFYYGASPTDTSDKRADDIKNYRDLVLKAAQQEPPDSQFVMFTAVQLDRGAQFALAEDLLSRALTKFNDPRLKRSLAQRLWQDRKFDKVVALLDQLDTNSVTTENDLIAYKAMSLFSVNKPADGKVLLDALAARDTDKEAIAWSTALKVQYTEPDLTPKERLEIFQQSLQDDPDNPVILDLVADVYWHMGENDLALQAWSDAASRVPSWSEPHVRIAEIYAGEGRVGPAADVAAQQALQTSAKGEGTYDYQAVVAQAKVRFARLQDTKDPDEMQRLLEFVQIVQTQMPGEPGTLPIYVTLLIETNQRDKAIDIIKLSDTRADQYGEDLLLQLAQISRNFDLGLETDVYSTIEKQFGLTPRLAYARAINLLQAGRSGDGLKYLLDSKPKGAGTPQLWDQVTCQYREFSRDPAAAGSWKALGEAYPRALPVQSAILFDETSAWADRPFIDKTISRLQDLTGDQAAGWKIARARWLLNGDDTQRDCSAAVDLIHEVLISSASEVGPHELLAEVYEKLGNKSGALAEWRQAADIAPTSPPILLGLLRALYQNDQTEESREVFDKIARLPSLPPDLALHASLIMASQGDPARAQILLKAYPNTTDQNLHDSTLAKVDRMLGQINDAATLYFKLDQSPHLDADTIREAADFFGSQRDIPAARKYLDRLNGMELPPGKKELILGEFEEDYGKPAAAAEFYQAAAKLDPSNPEPALHQIGFLMRQEQWADAQKSIDAALASWPNDASLASLKTVNMAIKGKPQLADQMGSVIGALTRDAMDAAALETFNVYSVADTADPAQTLKGLQAVIAKYPRFLPAYELTVRQLLALHQTNAAVTLAGAAMDQFPESPESARISAEAYAAVGQWNDVIAAATRWRQRGADQPEKADMLIAVADMFLDQPSVAVQRLAPYIPDAKADPDNNQDLIVDYSEALIRSGSEADADALLRPLAEKSAAWRFNWLKLSAFAHATGAASIAWIDKIRPLLDANSIDDQLHVANAYFDTAIHLGEPRGFDLAAETLKPFIDTPNATVPALLTYALACGSSGDSADAEHAYRAILKLDPQHAVAQNNLAEILRAKGDTESLKQAEVLARGAIAVNPADPDAANYFDTLARILLKENRHDEALAAFQQGDSLDPRNLSILTGLAATTARLNQLNDAIRYLARIDGLISPNTRLSDESQAELADARSIVQNGTTPTPTTSPDAASTAK